MKNIFKNAYFGKQYKTRDGRKAIYTIMSCDSHWLAIQDTSFTWEYNDNGELITGIDNAMNIISEWDEEIDEEELDKLATEYVKNIYQDDYCDFLEQEGEAFKAGYRKARRNI